MKMKEEIVTDRRQSKVIDSHRRRNESRKEPKKVATDRLVVKYSDNHQEIVTRKQYLKNIARAQESNCYISDLTGGLSAETQAQN